MKRKTKKIVYLILWVIVGILFAILIGSIIQAISYLIVGRLSLVSVLYGVLITAGCLFGLICGPFFWKRIYIDGVRGKKYIIKNEK